MPKAFGPRGEHRLDTVCQGPDEFRMAFNGPGHAVVRNAKIFRELAVFDIDLAESFDVVRDKSDRNDQKFFVPAARERLQHALHGWFQPLQWPHRALIRD